MTKILIFSDKGFRDYEHFSLRQDYERKKDVIVVQQMDEIDDDAYINIMRRFDYFLLDLLELAQNSLWFYQDYFFNFLAKRPTYAILSKMADNRDPKYGFLKIPVFDMYQIRFPVNDKLTSSWVKTFIPITKAGQNNIHNLFNVFQRMNERSVYLKYWENYGNMDGDYSYCDLQKLWPDFKYKGHYDYSHLKHLFMNHNEGFDGKSSMIVADSQLFNPPSRTIILPEPIKGENSNKDKSAVLYKKLFDYIPQLASDYQGIRVIDKNITEHSEPVTKIIKATGFKFIGKNKIKNNYLELEFKEYGHTSIQGNKMNDLELPKISVKFNALEIMSWEFYKQVKIIGQHHENIRFNINTYENVFRVYSELYRKLIAPHFECILYRKDSLIVFINQGQRTIVSLGDVEFDLVYTLINASENNAIYENDVSVQGLCKVDPVLMRSKNKANIKHVSARYQVNDIDLESARLELSKESDMNLSILKMMGINRTDVTTINLNLLTKHFNGILDAPSLYTQNFINTLKLDFNILELIRRLPSMKDRSAIDIRMINKEILLKAYPLAFQNNHNYYEYKNIYPTICNINSKFKDLYGCSFIGNVKRSGYYFKIAPPFIRIEN